MKKDYSKMSLADIIGKDKAKSRFDSHKSKAKAKAKALKKESKYKLVY